MILFNPKYLIPALAETISFENYPKNKFLDSKEKNSVKHTFFCKLIISTLLFLLYYLF